MLLNLMYSYVLVACSCLLLLVSGLWRAVLEGVTGKAGHGDEDCTCTGTAACSDLEVIEGDPESHTSSTLKRSTSKIRNKYFI